jgi:hypothetical protein
MSDLARASHQPEVASRDGTSPRAGGYERGWRLVQIPQTRWPRVPPPEDAGFFHGFRNGTTPRKEHRGRPGGYRPQTRHRRYVSLGPLGKRLIGRWRPQTFSPARQLSAALSPA